jgi:type I thyroxine 5'-deiodinase
VYSTPADFKQRSKLADICVVKLGIKLPAIVDRFDDATETVYSGWPDRLYVIDVDGRIAYKSKPGPFGFKPADMEAALKRALARPIAARFPS